jgi:hypothetical protein
MKKANVLVLAMFLIASGMFSCTKQIVEPVLPAEEEFVFEMKIDTIGDWVLVGYYEDPETGDRIGVYEPIRDTLNFD